MRRRAVLPVIAEIFIIAVVAAAAIITYFWLAGYVGTTMDAGEGAQGEIVVESCTIDGPKQATLYVRNIGVVTVKIDRAYVDKELAQSVTQAMLSPGEVKTITVVVDPDSSTDLEDGAAHAIKLVCIDGTTTSTTVRKT